MPASPSAPATNREGSPAGISCDLQDRSNHRERHFNLFNNWLLDRFGNRYVVYGEWLGGAHAIYYDRLPHLFLEFDIYDQARACFLDTASKRALCRGMPFASVHVLDQSGQVRKPDPIRALVRPPLFRSPVWMESLARACGLMRDDYPKRLAKMDQSALSDGVYLKVERDGAGVGRYKWVRPEFVQAILDANEHWYSRIPVLNLLAGEAEPFPSFLQVAAFDVALYGPDQTDTWWEMMAAPAPSRPASPLAGYRCRERAAIPARFHAAAAGLRPRLAGHGSGLP